MFKLYYLHPCRLKRLWTASHKINHCINHMSKNQKAWYIMHVDSGLYIAVRSNNPSKLKDFLAPDWLEVRDDTRMWFEFK